VPIQGINVYEVIVSASTNTDQILQGEIVLTIRNAFDSAIAAAFLISIVAAGAAFVTSLGIDYDRFGSNTNGSVQINP
jgi:hypothetical protein